LTSWESARLRGGRFLFWFLKKKGGKSVDVQVPIHQKYVLSIDEAALYFHIGINRLRKLVSEHKNADWVLWNQTHALIKRARFEKFIDSVNAL
jgi:hypothetical protein